MISLGMDLLFNRKSNLTITYGFAPLLVVAVLIVLAYSQSNKWFVLTAALIILWAWYHNRKHYRQIIDIPTAKISSAPQGQIELSGIGNYLDGNKTYCPLSKIACLWYSYRVEDTSNNNRRVIDSGTSTTCFTLNDGSGIIIVDPEDAYVISSHNQTWQENDHRCTETVLFDNEQLYILGEFSHHNIHSNALHTQSQTSEILNEWKKDQAALKNRFDANKDGIIDSHEWENALQQAQTEALIGRAPKQSPLLQFIRKPKNGGLFILSNYPAQELAKRFRYWAWLDLTVFFITLALGSKIIH